MISPCFPCITLKRGVQIVAIIHLALSVILGIFELLELASDLPKPTIIVIVNASSLNSTGTDTGGNHVIHSALRHLIGSFAVGFVMSCSLWLGWTLWKGASKECRPKLNRWWWINVCLLMASLSPAIILSFVDGMPYLGMIDGIGIIFYLYSLWLVNVFIKKIPKDKKIQEPSAEDELNFTEFEEFPNLTL